MVSPRVIYIQTNFHTKLWSNTYILIVKKNILVFFRWPSFSGLLFALRRKRFSLYRYWHWHWHWYESRLWVQLYWAPPVSPIHLVFREAYDRSAAASTGRDCWNRYRNHLPQWSSSSVARRGPTLSRSRKGGPQ